MNPIIIFMLGVCVGALVNEIINLIQKSYGVLRIDHSNPGKDLYRIEFDDLATLDKKKFVILKIDNNANLSQK